MGSSTESGCYKAIGKGKKSLPEELRKLSSFLSKVRIRLYSAGSSASTKNLVWQFSLSQEGQYI
jgi:hypothetical protein